MTKCLYCASENKDNAVVCDFCGADLPQPLKKKKSKKWIFLLAIIGSLVLCCILLLISATIYGNSPEYKAHRTETAIWEATYPPTVKPTRTTRSTRTAVPTNTPKPTRTSRPQPTATVVPSATISPTATTEPSLQLLMEVAGLNYDEAVTAFDVIQSVGFTRIVELSFQVETEGQRYYLTDFGYTQPFVIVIEDNAIVLIGNDNFTFYSVYQGGIVDNISNHVLTSTEKSTFSYLAQEYVLASLRSPSTAEFPSLVWNADQWSIARDHNIVSVRSWVEAQNSFGVMIRSTFVAQFSYSTEELLYLVIDNTVIFGVPAEP